jgi:uncharacterized protein involved in response to NO
VRLLAHPLWLVGFRPFFALACLAGMSLPLIWALNWASGFTSTAVPPAPTLVISALQWHAHEMFFGFGAALLGGFLLTSSKNWVGIRGYHGLPLLLLALAWLLDRGLMAVGAFGTFGTSGTFGAFAASGAALPKSVILVGGSLYVLALTAMILSTLILHRKGDSYPDNLYFIIALPLLLPAKWLLLADGHFSDGVAMSTALFRLCFLIMLERTLTQFMRGIFQVTLPRHAPLDHCIKGLALALVLGWALPTTIQALLAGALAVLILVRWLRWYPRHGLSRIDLAVMYLGHLAIAAQLALDAASTLSVPPWVGSSTLHLFTLGTMGLIMPAMIIRISRGHTGRKVVFETADKAVLWLMLLALVLRVILPQVMPDRYPELILAAAMCWLAGFGMLAWRYLPMLIQPRIDGKEH